RNAGTGRTGGESLFRSTGWGQGRVAAGGTAPRWQTRADWTSLSIHWLFSFPRSASGVGGRAGARGRLTGQGYRSDRSPFRRLTARENVRRGSTMAPTPGPAVRVYRNPSSPLTSVAPQVASEGPLRPVQRRRRPSPQTVRLLANQPVSRQPG